MPARPALRLLPLTIAALVLLLAAKCVDLVRAVALPHLALSTAMVPPAMAAPPAKPEPKGEAKAVPAAHAEAKPAEAAPAEVRPTPTEPPVSDAERALLQDLRARRQELDRRDAAVAAREQALDAAQRKLAERVAELTSLQNRLERLESDRRQHDEANWRGLVKVYETMKPHEAAMIFNEMDMGVLLPVLDRMKEGRASAILSAMQPERARLATAQLAALRTQSVTTPPAS